MACLANRLLPAPAVLTNAAFFEFSFYLSAWLSLVAASTLAMQQTAVMKQMHTLIC